MYLYTVLHTHSDLEGNHFTPRVAYGEALISNWPSAKREDDLKLRARLPRIVQHEVQLPINRINNKMRECTIYANFFFFTRTLENIANVFYPSCKQWRNNY